MVDTLETFAEYFLHLAHRVFKRKNGGIGQDIDRWAQGLGPQYDEAQQTIFKLREEALIATCSDAALTLHGIDRKLPRYAGEDTESYRRRLLSAPDLYRRIGTIPGMNAMLSDLGYPGSSIYPCYKEKYKPELDQDTDLLPRWAEFIAKVVLNEASFNQNHRKVLVAELKRIKPGEGKLYRIELSLATQVQPILGVAQRLAIGFQQPEVRDIVRFDGTRSFNGSWVFDNGSIDMQAGMRRNGVPEVLTNMPTTFIKRAREDRVAARLGEISLPTITHIALGTGNHAPGDVNTPVTVPDTADGLENEVIRIPVTAIRLNSTTIRYSGTMVAGEQAGVTFTEDAIIDNAGRPVVIRTFAGKTKDIADIMDFYWDEIY